MFFFRDKVGPEKKAAPFLSFLVKLFNEPDKTAAPLLFSTGARLCTAMTPTMSGDLESL